MQHFKPYIINYCTMWHHLSIYNCLVVITIQSNWQHYQTKLLIRLSLRSCLKQRPLQSDKNFWHGICCNRRCHCYSCLSIWSWSSSIPLDLKEERKIDLGKTSQPRIAQESLQKSLFPLGSFFPVLMQEENRCARGKTCGSKFGLETNCTYSAGTGYRIWDSLVQSEGSTCFPLLYNNCMLTPS